MAASKEATQVLLDWSNGHPQALDQLMPLVYEELRRLARRYLQRERPDHTLQPTALVHEAYLRLIDQTAVHWQTRAHKALEVDPNFWLAHQALVEANLQKGRYAEALAACQKTRTPRRELLTGYIYARMGRRDEAWKIVAELQAAARPGSVWETYIAFIYTALGEKDRAFAWLEKAYEQRTVNLALIKITPLLDDLHTDPRFADLLRRMNLPPYDHQRPP